MNALLTIVFLTLFVVLHELGHFFAARKSGVAVSEFFVGFGPKLYSFKKNNTEYGIKAFPLGGYVKIPGMDENLADQVARIVRSVRQLDLKKHPSVSETLDWAKTLLLLGVEKIDSDVATETVNVLLKYRSDIEKAVKEFADNPEAIQEEEGAA